MSTSENKSIIRKNILSNKEKSIKAQLFGHNKQVHGKKVDQRPSMEPVILNPAQAPILSSEKLNSFF